MDDTLDAPTSFAPRDLDADPLAMRALAHPTRLQLIEELTLRGAMTATELAPYVDQSPSSCSFHLRMLAKYGFVEEAEGGVGRQRPWRVVSIGHRWRTGTGTGSAARTAGEALAAQVRRHDAELLEGHLARSSELSEPWDEAVIHSNFSGWLTAEELAALGDQLVAMWQPYVARLTDVPARPDGSRLVHMFMHGFPRADHEPHGAADPHAEGARGADPGA